VSIQVFYSTLNMERDLMVIAEGFKVGEKLSVLNDVAEVESPAPTITVRPATGATESTHIEVEKADFISKVDEIEKA
jgi:hypothetical protein